MPAFIQIPSFNIHGDREWVLEEPLIYDSDLAGIIEVPAGFVTDLASIPRVFRALLPQNDKHRLAAVVHDFLVRQAANRKARALADRVFLEAMKHLAVPFWKRWAMFLAVRTLTLLKRKFP